VLDPAKAPEIDRYFRTNDPRHAAVLHTTASPTMLGAGRLINVIPSDARASIDVRTLPDEDPAEILALVREVIDDPHVKVEYGPRNVRPAGLSRLDSEAFRTIEAAAQRHYQAVTIPTMSTGGTDMAYLRGRGVQCYGIGPAIDEEDGPRGFGAHSDQERILEAELYRFVRFNWDVVLSLAAAR
jgi:acetylornithine deacetylase/succinyl-diaminopimelate desuccinylase-like protein